ncbi:MAG TPA: HD domain-containing protein [Candidatus Limnocylindria bacterium]|nr:HD domain-containing protein [Candidatus Limnocylindria bacterium]
MRDAGWELAEALSAHGADLDVDLVTAAAWLHDIGRSPLVRGDARDHADLSGLIVAAEGLPELVEIVRRHPVYTLNDPLRAPRTLPERIVYYADRRGGLAIMSAEERLREQAERFPEHAAAIRATLAPVKALERELFAGLPFGPDQLCARR